MDLLQTLSLAWWSWVAPLSIQVAAVAVAVGAIDRLLGRRLWPRQRSLLWSLILIRLVLPAHWVPQTAAVQWEGVSAEISGTPPWVVGLFLFWLAIAGLLATFGLRRYRARTAQWFLHGTDAPVDVRVLVQECAARLRLSGVPAVWMSCEVESPAVIGLRRPRLILPVGFLRRYSRRAAHEIVLHELAHLKHRDPLATCVGIALQTLYWFHPAVWWTNAHLMRLREEACDLSAANAAFGTESYRETLVEATATHHAPMSALCFLRARASLHSRLETLEQYRPQHATWRRMVTGMLVLLLALTASVTAPTPKLPDFSHLASPGCFQTRYQVLAKLAQQQTPPGKETP